MLNKLNDDSTLKALAQKLAPIVYLHSEEAYFPASVDWYLTRCCLIGKSAVTADIFYGGQNHFDIPKSMPILVPCSNLTVDALVNASSSTNLGSDKNTNVSIFPCIGTNPQYSISSPMSDYQIETLNGEPLTTDNKCTSEAYVHISNPDTNVYLFSYYFFYPYNGGMGPTAFSAAKPLGIGSGYYAHIGDWETIMAIVTIDNINANPNISLLGIVYEAHGKRILMADDDHVFFNKTIEQINQIVVYSAWHSHSSRTAAGVYPTNTVVAKDYTNKGAEWDTSENLVFLDDSDLSNVTPAWLEYDGLWGANIKVLSMIPMVPCQVAGPPGPAFHTSWNESLSDVIFWDSRQYDSGINLNISLCNTDAGIQVVEVHQSQADTLWYHVGTLNENEIVMGESQKYDSGIKPSVAVYNDGSYIKIIEVHQSESHSTLWYHVGTLQADGTIEFGASQKYDSGINPSVAVYNDGNDTKIIEVHQSESHNTLWYHVGTLQADGTIEFGASQKYDSGINPSVAVYNNGQDTKIIEVHQSQNYTTLWYRLGTLQEDGTIAFGDSQQYDNGTNPSVAVYNDGNYTKIIEVHQSQNYTTLWYHLGILNENTEKIEFGYSQKYDGGLEPSIAVCHTDNGFAVVENHKLENDDTLWYQTGRCF